jgi:hypothetical protein
VDSEISARGWQRERLAAGTNFQAVAFAGARKLEKQQKIGNFKVLDCLTAAPS